MRFLIPIALFAAVLSAQEKTAPDEPPADVDTALRARIAEFYQYHVDGQFRKAEEMVAEDTKDLFYNSNKPRYLSFEIKSIQYSDQFTRAKAVVLCEQYVMVPGMTGHPMKLNIPSTWKLENGKWYWYVSEERLRQTPVGITMNPGTAMPGGLPGLPSIPTTADFALNKVKADKGSVTLKPGESAEVTFSNSAAGTMTISLEAKAAGIEVAPEHLGLKQGEKAAITLKALKDAKSVVLQFRVDQTAEIIPIRVAVE